ncbi:hypothetical protein JOD43_004063 [Pullulanibacillus pueri]|uniref:Uncharacterized protein n=1 Tax=Pullulanibacillus pueri TaxID=1437324 RepID=A0A8J2ZXQ1_9BACL|nr:hypothetical protein [Pullulanibacillus pueri]MBM7683872.1 hypothetical protein [Pullulanibacillus pueri]GGH84623.1 hypothetical protein GCM10007096_28130 [Pullulanibacillus pueri]
MKIQAHIKQLTEENKPDNPLYRTLEIHMQRMGFLVPYREELNWTTEYETIELGEEQQLIELQKLAAKNDGGTLFFAKITKNTIYQQVICHPNKMGVYLPFHFETPFTVKVARQKYWVGSAPRLQNELKWLEIAMNNSGEEEVKAYWENLKTAVQTAIDRMSPIVLETEAAS